MKGWATFFYRHYIDEWKFMSRSLSLLLILMFVPLFYPLVVSFLYQANLPSRRPVIIMDADNSALSRRLTLWLDATQGIEVTGRTGSFAEGSEAVKSGRAEMLVSIPAGFSKTIMHRDQAHLSIWVNSENILSFSAAMEALNEVVMTLNEDLGKGFFQGKGMTTTLAESHIMPVKLSKLLLFTPVMGYGNFLITGIFLIVLQQIVLLALATTVGARREKGIPVFERPFPITWMLAKAAAQVTFYLGAIFFISLVVFPMFGWSVKSMSALLLLFVVFMFAAIPLCMFAAAFIRDRQSAFQILVFFSTPIFMISGFTWPLDQMPRYIQIIAWCFPTTPALHAMRLVSSKTGELSVIAPYLWLTAALGAFYFLLAALNIRYGAGKH